MPNPVNIAWTVLYHGICDSHPSALMHIQPRSNTALCPCCCKILKREELLFAANLLTVIILYLFNWPASYDTKILKIHFHCQPGLLGKTWFTLLKSRCNTQNNVLFQAIFDENFPAQQVLRKRHKQKGQRNPWSKSIIIPKREIELAQAATVSYHHRTGGGGHRGKRLKYTELHTILDRANTHPERSGLGSEARGKIDRNYKSIFCLPNWPELMCQQPFW